MDHCHESNSSKLIQILYIHIVITHKLCVNVRWAREKIELFLIEMAVYNTWCIWLIREKHTLYGESNNTIPTLCSKLHKVERSKYVKTNYMDHTYNAEYGTTETTHKTHWSSYAFYSYILERKCSNCLKHNAFISSERNKKQNEKKKKRCNRKYVYVLCIKRKARSFLSRFPLFLLSFLLHKLKIVLFPELRLWYNEDGWRNVGIKHLQYNFYCTLFAHFMCHYAHPLPDVSYVLLRFNENWKRLAK